MNNYHGIIFAYKSYPELRELVAERTAASLPICSRYLRGNHTCRRVIIRFS